MIDRCPPKRIHCEKIIPRPQMPPQGDKHMRSINRRDFLHDSAILAALAGAGVGSESLAAEKAIAKKGQVNDQLRVAVVGIGFGPSGGRGMSHVAALAGNERLNTIITTVCDADAGNIAPAMKTIEKKQGK